LAVCIGTFGSSASLSLLSLLEPNGLPSVSLSLGEEAVSTAAISGAAPLLRSGGELRRCWIANEREDRVGQLLGPLPSSN
jgi:hypothetical protein